jgi:hypothetical protein
MRIKINITPSRDGRSAWIKSHGQTTDLPWRGLNPPAHRLFLYSSNFKL